MKTARKNTKLAAQTRLNVGSWRGCMNSFKFSGLGFGSNLDFTVTLATTINPRIVKAATLIVHANPIWGISLSTMIGKITPPSDEPAVMIPKAVDRFLKNQVATDPIVE
jgi:hypothetical protein